ncbi:MULTISPECIES: N-acetylneuraminate lyase [unclassified Paenibacillus]|uniref:N-acetylneuraminate lyase n=1 Tax=unclassified Paenibacillus TaxID=185978 RepID=UPI00277E4FEF|nr:MULTISPECIES: N-acetylneuraminate lyase [unclassified Paenibacillus]MDQ0898971.1 N-acetylneuraminate lyase [Paenibacillus sp. V4I7]MDQ0915043.1 N-acetylneuraminate lyase [Paenibacillus sp. V4I5]
MTNPIKNRDSFRGIFTALLTPMYENGAIDFDSLTRLVEHQIEQGIHGFYVGGSTGEGFILTSEERKQVLEVVVRAAAGRVTIISHVGCISTMESINLAKHAELQGVDAVSAVVPFYYKVSMKEIREHYEAIMAAVSLPMIVYHFPGATGVSLSMDFYEQMSRNPQCIGVKFTSLNLFEMQQIRARCGQDFLIFNGHDEVYSAGAYAGANGAIGSTFNMMPGLFAQMYELIVSEDRPRMASIQSMQAEANEAIAHMIQFDVIAYEKYMLYLQGILATPTVRQPLKQFTTEEREQIESFYAQSEVLKRYRKQAISEGSI